MRRYECNCQIGKEARGMTSSQCKAYTRFFTFTAETDICPYCGYFAMEVGAKQTRKWAETSRGKRKCKTA